MDFTFRALPVWPHPTTGQRRTRWAFRAHWSDTLHKLGYEIEALDGSEAVIAAGFTPADIRLDGLPRSNAKRPAHPGIEISFKVPAHGRQATRGDAIIEKHGSLEAALKATHPDTSGYESTADFQAVMEARRQSDARRVFATDAYELWEHNVRAIALTLEALRACDRYGATQGRQYAGFAQLTAGGAR